LASCAKYNPSLFPSYDVLNPGEEVRKNPLGFTTDGNIIVNAAFIQWVSELQAEIKKLRK
jgi:hypothetical protein